MLLNIVWCHTQANGRSICLKLITLLLMCPLPQRFSEPRLHLFFFLLPKSEEEELCALHLHVKKVMLAVHRRTQKVECLVQIADEW